MAAPFATTAGVPATIAQRFRGVAITQRAAAWAVQAGKHTSLAGHWEIDRARARISAHGLQGSPRNCAAIRVPRNRPRDFAGWFGGVKLAEPTSGLDWNQRLLGAHFELLNGPTVAIWIVETEEGAAIALVKDSDFASLDATSQQLVARRNGIGDDKLQSFHRPRRHCPLRRQVAEDDRASRPGWGQLHDVHELVASVVIEMEANLISVEGDRAVDVADRQNDDFE
jgi:hypothetical protein